MKYALTCIVCPLGCVIEVEIKNGEIISVANYKCPRGKEWAIEEILSPVRPFMSVVRVIGGIFPVVSVKSTGPVPKENMKDLTKLLSNVVLQAPVPAGTVVLHNPMGLKVDIVTTRDA